MFTNYNDTQANRNGTEDGKTNPVYGQNTVFASDLVRMWSSTGRKLTVGQIEAKGTTPENANYFSKMVVQPL